jgi:hypothetical protein
MLSFVYLELESYPNYYMEYVVRGNSCHYTTTYVNLEKRKMTVLS